MNTLKTFTVLALGATVLSGAATQMSSAHGTDKTKAQEVSVSVDSQGFHPATLSVKAGQPVHLKFVVKGASCASAVVLPTLKQTVSLKGGRSKEIVFTPKKGQIVGFACNMKMFQGKVTAK